MHDDAHNVVISDSVRGVGERNAQSLTVLPVERDNGKVAVIELPAERKR